MKLKLKKVISVFLIMGIISAGALTPVSATEKEKENLSEKRILIEQGNVSLRQAEEIQKELQDYFDFRQDSYVAEESKVALLNAENTFERETIDRNSSLREFWKTENIDIVSIETESQIRDVVRSVNQNDLQVQVYEWTWVYYNNGEGADAAATDYMGFATEHEIVMTSQGDGKYIITSDLYDESDISGYTAPGFVAKEVVDSIPTYPEEAVQTYATSSLNRDGMPFVWNAIAYADAWVKHDISSGTSAQTSYYNPTYGAASPTQDCANYVNQCLSNSGFKDDPQSTSNRNASSSSQFWHNRDGQTKSTNSSYVWRTVDGIISYWGDRYSYEAINSSKSNVFPGNPVITSNKGHVAICVGYNSAGVPIINGHTRDVFHQVLSGYTKTIKINTTNRLGTTPANATTIKSFPYSDSAYLGSEKCKWYQFTVPSAGGKYTFATTGNSTMQGTLYKKTESGSYQTMAMYPLKQVNGTTNFTLNTGSLASGTYFLLVKHVASSSTGSYTLTAKKTA